METEKKELGKWWMWILFLFVITIAVLGFTGTIGKWMGTGAERLIFEQSYQRSEAFKARIATYKAQSAMINSKLMTVTNDELRNQLQAQLDMLTVQIASAEAQK